MEYTSFYELAEQFAVGIDTIRRNVKRLGLNVHSRVTPNSKGARIHHLTSEDAERLRTYFEGLAVGEDIEDSDNEQGPALQRFGFFYVIQLVPEAIPNRVKIGFTDNIDQRLTEHRTAAPTARLIKSWRCKRCWDQAAMDAITREGCSLVLNEVYEGEPDGFVQRGDAFFEQLPNANGSKLLSPHSPLLGIAATDTD
jgi:hypothetical protein